VACIRDRVPIGVYQQIQNNPSSRYLNRGLAGVIEKVDDYFIIADITSASTRSKISLLEELFRNELSEVPASGTEQSVATYESVPTIRNSTKLRIWAEVVRRQGQNVFRKRVIDAYQGRCCISGTSTVSVLDAAHIKPYEGLDTNVVTNGLLLRTDLHVLFDLSLLGIEPVSHIVRVNPVVVENVYRQFDGVRISLPCDVRKHPNSAYLKWRWDEYLSTFSD
jgi:predicted restriction endonuclease